MPRLIGKLPARHDARLAKLSDRMNAALLPPLPQQVQWHAKLPAGGIPMLANDYASCCVEASVCHYLEQIGLYTGRPITPTVPECLQIYSDVAGYRPGNPATDQGTYFAGPGGMLEHWARQGVVVGGKRNHCGPVAKVDWRNPDELQHAIQLFGYVFVGASLTQADVDTPFLLDTQVGPTIGGHEFLVTGFERTAHATRYDILTWSLMLRASDAWINAAVDEAYVVYNTDFINAHGLSPGGIDHTALLADMRAFTVA